MREDSEGNPCLGDTERMILPAVLVLIILIPSVSGVFILDSGEKPENLTPGDEISFNASVLLVPEGQPFPIDHSLVISGDLDNQIFDLQVNAGDVPGKSYTKKDGAVFINGQFISYRVSPHPEHQYGGSRVTIDINTYGTVPRTTEGQINLVEVIELDSSGRPVYDGIDAIRATISLPDDKGTDGMNGIPAGTAPEQSHKSPAGIILVLSALPVALCIARMRPA